MDKVKKLVVFPVSLLLIELLLQFNNASIYQFQYMQFDFWKFVPSILLSFLAVLLSVCGIAVLFLWVFGNVPLKSLLNRQTAKAVGIAFLIYYLTILLVVPALNSLLSHFYRQDSTPWLYLLLNALVLTIKLFFLISLTLWLILKPLCGKFTFHTKAFFLAAFLCLTVNLLFVYADCQITNAVYSAIETEKAGNGTIGYLSMLAQTNQYYNWLRIVSAIVFAIQDVIILVFINSCIKHKEKVEIQNI